MDRSLEEYQRRFPKFYELVCREVGQEDAPRMFMQCMDDSLSMSKDDTERAAYAYVALRRRLRIVEDAG